METKQCTKCKETMALEFFSSNGPRLKSACKSCTNKVRKHKLSALSDDELKAFRQKQVATAIKWNKNNPEKCKANAIKYNSTDNAKMGARRRNNSLEGRDKRNAQHASYRESLHDSYVTNVILNNSKHNKTGLKYEDITPELIEMKRKQLKLYRDVKKNKNKSKSS